MKVKITATAPTHYQYTSIRSFGLPIDKHGNGSFTISAPFSTKKEAINHLIQRAETNIEDPDKLKIAKREIRKFGQLQLDAVCSRIETI